eukprot:Skav228081  [mRNA]  locus=scaffold5285:96904:98132:+ [translate_table: standard]
MSIPQITAKMAGIISHEPKRPGCQASAKGGRMAKAQKIFPSIHITIIFRVSQSVRANAEMCFRIMMCEMSEDKCEETLISRQSAKAGLVDIM